MKKITNRGAVVLMVISLLIGYAIGHESSNNHTKKLLNQQYCYTVENAILYGQVMELDGCESMPNYIDLAVQLQLNKLKQDR